MFTLRLINRGLYPNAMEICKYLKLPPASGEVKILREWALRKVVSILNPVISNSTHFSNVLIASYVCRFKTLQ